MQPSAIDLAQLRQQRELQALLEKTVYVTPSPGDKMIVFMPGITPPQVIQLMEKTLSERHPEVQWTIISGATHVIHEANRPEQTPQSGTDAKLPPDTSWLKTPKVQEGM